MAEVRNARMTYIINVKPIADRVPLGILFPGIFNSPGTVQLQFDKMNGNDEFIWLHTAHVCSCHDPSDTREENTKNNRKCDRLMWIVGSIIWAVIAMNIGIKCSRAESGKVEALRDALIHKLICGWDSYLAINKLLRHNKSYINSGRLAH